MDIRAALTSFIYLVASSLLYPVLLLLAVLVAWLLLQMGAFLAEWLERRRLGFSKAKGPFNAKKTADSLDLPHRVSLYKSELQQLLNQGHILEVQIQELLQTHIQRANKSLDGLRMLVRIGPGLGLMATLIPMGTGLAALAQGDMTKLASELVVAFTATVVGLFEGMTAYFLFTVKGRWVEEDIRHMELLTELLANEEGEL